MARKILKWVAIAALFASVAWNPSVGYRLLLAFFVTVIAVAVRSPAVRGWKPAWVALFAIIATLLNPALTGLMQHSTFLWADLGCLGACIASLIFVGSQPVLAIAAIADRTPGSESL